MPAQNRNSEKNSAKETKKIDSRQLLKRQNVISNVSAKSLAELMVQLNQYDEEANKEFLSPRPRPDGRYVTSEGNLDQWIDQRIFRETQIKRFVRWLTTTPPLLRLFFAWLFIEKLGMKVAYFDQDEDRNPDKIYKTGDEHEITSEESDRFTIHNIGHATQLIQTSGMNILTDPVFGNLAPLVYPSMTKRFNRNFQVEDLPPIDVILISHNHRDHVDVKSLQALLEKADREHVPQPQLLVPQGDEDFFRDLGFTHVRDFEWHEHITLYSNTDEPITFCSTAADHRSGRNGHDSHQSLVMGWVLSPKNRHEILYFAGDTAKISDIRMNSLALDIYHLYQHKKQLLVTDELPKIINMEPGGPNYTRKDMQPTHQSAVDSIVSSFKLAIALNQISSAATDNRTTISAEKWLNATATIFMHQNKYELGPDRFNENIFIFNRLLSYLQMSDDTLLEHKGKQQAKSNNWSLFHRRKDFIIEGVSELRELAKLIWPKEEAAEQNRRIIQFIQSRTHFPLINQKITSEDAFQFSAEERSTIIPDTADPSKGGKLKGAKEEECSFSATSVNNRI
jgi:L-ascorbate metabolism protein UlaG (beta-lactamase superfamily)